MNTQLKTAEIAEKFSWTITKLLFDRLLSLLVNLTITNLIFIFSLVLLFLSEIGEGGNFSSLLVFFSTIFFVILNLLSLVLFLLAIIKILGYVDGLASDDDFFKQIPSEFRTIKNITISGVSIMGINCTLYFVILATVYF